MEDVIPYLIAGAPMRMTGWGPLKYNVSYSSAFVGQKDYLNVVNLSDRVNSDVYQVVRNNDFLVYRLFCRNVVPCDVAAISTADLVFAVGVPDGCAFMDEDGNETSPYQLLAELHKYFFEVYMQFDNNRYKLRRQLYVQIGRDENFGTILGKYRLRRDCYLCNVVLTGNDKAAISLDDEHTALFFRDICKYGKQLSAYSSIVVARNLKNELPNNVTDLTGHLDIPHKRKMEITTGTVRAYITVGGNKSELSGNNLYSKIIEQEDFDEKIVVESICAACYLEAVSCEFTINGLLQGIVPAGVSVDKSRSVITCDVMPHEKIQAYKIVLDDSELKDLINFSLDDNKIECAGNEIVLKGRDILRVRDIKPKIKDGGAPYMLSVTHEKQSSIGSGSQYDYKIKIGLKKVDKVEKQVEQEKNSPVPEKKSVPIFLRKLRDYSAIAFPILLLLIVCVFILNNSFTHFVFPAAFPGNLNEIDSSTYYKVKGEDLLKYVPAKNDDTSNGAGKKECSTTTSLSKHVNGYAEQSFPEKVKSTLANDYLTFAEVKDLWNEYLNDSRKLSANDSVRDQLMAYTIVVEILTPNSPDSSNCTQVYALLSLTDKNKYVSLLNEKHRNLVLGICCMNTEHNDGKEKKYYSNTTQGKGASWGAKVYLNNKKEKPKDDEKNYKSFLSLGNFTKERKYQIKNE